MSKLSIERFMLALLACCIGLQAFGQTSSPNSLSEIDKLVAEERWPEIVRLMGGSSDSSPQLKYIHGLALAKVGHWAEARAAFLIGTQIWPNDKRFPLELAGVEFHLKRYPQAASWLRRALKVDPNDTYANDFLGSVYFLQGNLDAALKYWNRVGKPHIESVTFEPEPRIRSELLDRAFAFSPASTLRLTDLRTTEARIGGLGIFPQSSIELTARPDGTFDAVFRSVERNGWGHNKYESLFSFFRGIFRQTVYPEYFNSNQSAINLVSLVRWDAQKRRLMSAVSGPIRHNPKWRYQFGVDLRNENWEFHDNSRSASSLGSLNLRRESVGAWVSSIPSGRWTWSTGVELSHRDFRDVLGSASAETSAFGYQLKHVAEAKYDFWRRPENRIDMSSTVSTEIGRIWSQPSHPFAKAQGALAGHWFPQGKGDDYEMRASARVGKTVGAVPLDELFVLGVEHDNDLWLRAHPGTYKGRKGSGAIGPNYFLSNWELDKNVYRNGLLTAKLGPFVDNGKLYGNSLASSPHEWLWDTGLQSKVRVLGVGLVLLYGKDLRSGRNTFYATVERSTDNPATLVPRY